MICQYRIDTKRGRAHYQTRANGAGYGSMIQDGIAVNEECDDLAAGGGWVGPQDVRRAVGGIGVL